MIKEADIYTNGNGVRHIDDMRIQVINQNRDRLVWQAQREPEFFENYLREEFQELEAEIVPDKEPSRWGIASELGDIEYLCTRYQDLIAPRELPEEVANFRRIAWQIAEQFGLNMADCVHLKVIRNDLKYPMSICNMHEYQEGRDKCRKLWALMGGDKAFYLWYEAVFGPI